MGGHGGLNILPQKRWNVYNFDNREKVRLDEEAAAKEEQIKREQSRKRDSEFRLDKLRQARGLAPPSSATATETATATTSASSPEPKSDNHINLFEGIKIFDPVENEGRGGRFKKMKKEAPLPPPRVVLPEDEKYRMGYGVAGKGVKLPWYLSKRSDNAKVERDDDDDDEDGGREEKKSSGKKKTLEEMREERLRREKREKERERAVVLEKSRRRDGGDVLMNKGFSRRSGK